MRKCDIIVPIYNAYDAVEQCINSIIKNTDLNNNNLILINDKSTDTRIESLLKRYKELYSNKNIIVINNKENLGFVGSVNVGMKFSKNDVLLLNSDTEVGENWLINISNCAYSQPKVATVTPLSNNATLVSVPVGLQQNELPKNMSFDDYTKFVSEISYRDYPELPTAHGFCMYIRREALDEVGYFDEKTYGKGYGEENDFSFRCLDYGYKNLLCDDTLVYHKESQSFTDSKIELINKHSKILKDAYPTYARRIELWCQNFPINYICKNIKYSLNIIERRNILIIVHDWKNVPNNIGGTTLHVYDIIRNLRDKYNFHVLAPEDGGYKLYSYFENEEDVIFFPGIDTFSIINRYSDKYRKMLELIIESFDISLVHVHHIMGHYFDIGEVLKEKKVYKIITLHDYYLSCPSINMLYNMEKLCINMTNKDCLQCLKNRFGINNNIIKSWESDCKKLLFTFDKIISPSEDLKNYFSNLYSNLNIDVIEHGIDIPINDYIPRINEEKINIAVVGAMSIHKGADIFEKLISSYRSKNVIFHLFGISEIESLTRNRSNYIYHGAYSREQLPNLLKENNINLCCFLSICAETFSYTLSEVVASNVPVLAIDLGAVGDRVKKNNYGWVVSPNSTHNDIKNKIAEILKDKENYNLVVEKIRKIKIKSIDEMVKEYEEIYSNSRETKRINKKLKNVIKDSFKTSTTISNAELMWILNSTKWKIISKINAPNFLKKLVKKVIK